MISPPNFALTPAMVAAAVERDLRRDVARMVVPHEAGHAFVALAEGATAVAVKVGVAEGVTFVAGKGLRPQLRIAVAGRIAEGVLLGEIRSGHGAAKDLLLAYRLALDLVTEEDAERAQREGRGSLPPAEARRRLAEVSEAEIRDAIERRLAHRMPRAEALVRKTEEDVRRFLAAHRTALGVFATALSVVPELDDAGVRELYALAMRMQRSGR